MAHTERPLSPALTPAEQAVLAALGSEAGRRWLVIDLARATGLARPVITAALAVLRRLELARRGSNNYWEAASPGNADDLVVCTTCGALLGVDPHAPGCRRRRANGVA